LTKLNIDKEQEEKYFKKERNPTIKLDLSESTRGTRHKGGHIIMKNKAKI
jgi:hypothetical protein